MIESVTCKRVTLSSPISSRLIFARPMTSRPIAMNPIATALSATAPTAIAPIDCAPTASARIAMGPSFLVFPRFRLISSRYLRARDFNVAAVRLSATSPFSRNMDSPVILCRLSEYFRFVLRRTEPDRRPCARKLNMICGVHGSPGYSVTEPTWSKRTPAGTALACAGGFFICAQPAIPARAAPAITQINKAFSYRRNRNSSRTASTAALLAGRFCAQDRLKNSRRNAPANPGVANLCLLRFSGNQARRSCIRWNNRRHRSSPNRA